MLYYFFYVNIYRGMLMNRNKTIKGMFKDLRNTSEGDQEP